MQCSMSTVSPVTRSRSPLDQRRDSPLGRGPLKQMFRGMAYRVLCLLLITAGNFLATSEAQTKHYVCVPCGLPCDSKVYDRPGKCPACGMALVDEEEARAAAASAGSRKKVAILIFDGVQIIDYTGPYEVFGSANFDVYTVAEQKKPVTTAMGMTVVPKYSFSDAPRPDVLVVPGGGVNAAQRNETILKWIRDETAHTEHTMSVCNGAFILASAGLLDGLSATTTSGNIERLKSTYPKINVIDDQRFVDNGKIITTGGLTAGIDGALHVVSVMMGEGYAQQVALGEEYDWHPRGDFARPALADRLYLSYVDPALDAIGKWSVVSTQGGTDRWEINVRGTSTISAPEVMDRLSQAFTDKGQWTKITDAAPGSSQTSHWNFSGRDGKPWTGTLTVQPGTGDGHELTIKLSISRAG